MGQWSSQKRKVLDGPEQLYAIKAIEKGTAKCGTPLLRRRL
jgi:hypothetical protein